MRHLTLALAIGLLQASCVLAAESMDGIWRSRGWGLVFRMHGAALQVWEVTSTTCVAGFTAKLQQRATPGTVIFRRSDGSPFSISRTGLSHQLRVEDPERMATILIERSDRLPEPCSVPPADTPLANFDVFAQTFAEHYIAFDRRGVSWAKSVAAERSRITAATTPEQLFEILSRLLQPLTDIHTSLDAPALHRSFAGSFRPGTDRVMGDSFDEFEKTGRARLTAITDAAHLRKPPQVLCNGQWQFGRIGSDTGYLRILAFGGYSTRGRYRENLRALHRAFDRILRENSVRALIIDLRVAFGGDDRLALALASRLTDRTFRAFTIRAASGPNRAAPPQPVNVGPGRAPRFTGRIIALTGPVTMSAAETFLLSLMERSPRVLRIGENTQGVFCDSLERHLPNGWVFALPNATYEASGGKTFDVTGIPPDIRMPVFADADVTAGRDPAMRLALQNVNAGREEEGATQARW